MSDCAVTHGTRPVVVMGSVQLTSNVFSYVVGSITLSAIRRLSGVPVVVVTANSKQAPTKAGMRCMALVEGHARAMLSFLCTTVLDTPRGDKLMLGQVMASKHMTRQQAANCRQLLDKFHQIAFGKACTLHPDLSWAVHLSLDLRPAY